MRFYLGTHMPNWLPELHVPLFVSYKRLIRYRRLPVAAGQWSLDSGAFSEISQHGRWTISLPEYIDNVRRFSTEIGNMHWAAPQDWMCEPHMTAKTGLSVVRHQLRTVTNFCELVQAAPDIPWIPVLQGWTQEDFERCVDVYAEHGVDLTTQPVVGLGSVCRRQHTEDIGLIVKMLSTADISLHGFGVKKTGLVLYGHHLTSADSMAWSFDARYTPVKLDLCTHPGPCANCQAYALLWRRRMLDEYAAAQV